MNIFKCFILLNFVILSALATSAYANKEKCYFVGKENEKAILGVRDFAVNEDALHISLVTVIKQQCTVKELNQILKKFSACIGFSMTRNPSMSLRIPKPKDDKTLKEIIFNMQKEKCFSVLKEVPTPPVPAGG